MFWHVLEILEISRPTFKSTQAFLSTVCSVFAHTSPEGVSCLYQSMAQAACACTREMSGENYLLKHMVSWAGSMTDKLYVIC